MVVLDKVWFGGCLAKIVVEVDLNQPKKWS